MDELIVRCSALAPDGTFFPENTGRGEDRSPAFLLENLSPAAVTLAVTLEDTSHPLFRNFTHWVLWNVPAAPKIPANMPHGRVLSRLGMAQQGMAYGLYRYAGPKPPKGHSHTYRFTVFVLGKKLCVPWPGTKKQFLTAASGHILQQGTVTGTYE